MSITSNLKHSFLFYYVVQFGRRYARAIFYFPMTHAIHIVDRITLQPSNVIHVRLILKLLFTTHKISVQILNLFSYNYIVGST